MRTIHIEDKHYFQVPIFSTTNKNALNSKIMCFSCTPRRLNTTYNVLRIFVHVSHLAIIIFVAEMNVQNSKKKA